jgi:magnesium chelatase family protein
MSLALLYSRALVGVEAPLVRVEVHLANGLPSFTIVGLAEAEVKEARERVRAALVTSGFEFPARRITVNLAPADLPKDSGRFDLPIALGVLVAAGQLRIDDLDQFEFAGELSLAGDLRPVRGALAMTYGASRSGRQFVLPSASAQDAALVQSATVYGVATLLAACELMRNETPRVPTQVSLPARAESAPDLAEVRGQLHAKRALEIAAAGGHSLLMIGPPGAGKSMLAHRLPGILPALTEAQALESAAIQSIGTAGFDLTRWSERPFRAPHHSCSNVAMIGGGNPPRPGEISLAHLGILFLDELPEFDRRVLEVLRQPLETGRAMISRAARQAEFPAACQLVAAMNPCPCGYLGHARRACRCTPDQIQRYRSKLSGPLLDRIDLHVEVLALDEHALMGSTSSTTASSATVRARVEAAFERQLRRQSKSNALLTPRELDMHARLEPTAETLLRAAIEKLDVSARGHQRILKVARTVADLAASELISAPHIAEAVQYRERVAPIH